MKQFPKILFTVLLAFICFTLPLSASAFFSAGQQNLFVAKDQIIDGDYIAFGSNINIEGKVNGDVIAAGATVTITGDVAGDVIAAASSIKITGQVFGNVRVAGSTVEIAGLVDRNVNAAGSTVTIGDKAEINRNAYLVGASIQVNGPIKGELNVSGATIILSNEIGKSVYADLGGDGTIIIQPSAKINGNLTYKSLKSEQLELKEGAKISGTTNFEATKVKTTKPYGASYFFGKIFSLFGMLVIGLVLINLAPKKIKEVAAEMQSRPAVSLGWGLVYLIVTPVAAVLLLFTVIGIPLALIILPLYVISLFVSQVMAGMTLGIIILQKITKNTEIPKLLLAMILGLAVLVILTSIPVVGWGIKLLVIIWALGAGLTVKKKMMAEWR